MENTTNTKMSKKITDTARRGFLYLSSRKIQTLVLMYALFAPIFMVHAADAKWNTVINFFVVWIERLGGAVILVGGVEYGLAFKNDDADAKTRGIKTIIAGCIVLAVGLSSSIFLY